MEYTEFPMALCLVSAGIALQLTCEQAIQHYIAYYEEKHMPAPLALGKGDPSSDFGAAPAIESDESKQVELAERVEGGAISKKSFGPVDEQIEKYERTHAYIKAIGLECSIALHSIIIGFDLGLLGGDDIGTLRTMMAVLAVHQFFEGISLASVVLDTELAQWVKLLFGFIFAFTLPMGIMIGIGTSNQTSAGEYTRASFDAIAAGVLLYTALAELIVEDFNMPLLKNAHGTKMVMVFSFIVGIGIMALLVHFEVHDHDHDHEEDHEDHDDERRLSMIYVVESMLKSVF
jgi:zinc transporter 1/2/3